MTAARGAHSRVVLTDYPQIAEACSTILRSVTNEEETLLPDSQIPISIRALSPFYIVVSKNYATIEFHVGFDHYASRLKHANADAKQWTLYFYSDGSDTTQDEKPLTTITDG